MVHAPHALDLVGSEAIAAGIRGPLALHADRIERVVTLGAERNATKDKQEGEKQRQRDCCVKEEARHRRSSSPQGSGGLSRHELQQQHGGSDEEEGAVK